MVNNDTAVDELPRDNTHSRKEVDYYLNPTELFRWINYRRWDGAKARALSHPDECSTWIVSRHSTDGRILWRHLPLHLVCMQGENGSNESQNAPGYMQQNRQIAELVDILLEVFPDAANSTDDQGMLPLHLAVSNATNLNERILSLLLTAHPAGIEVKDMHGRTPIDLLREKGDSGPQYETALRALNRARKSTSELKKATKEENTAFLDSVKKKAENERTASQRIIMRLEEELANLRQQKEEVEMKSRNEEGSSNQLKAQIKAMKSDKQRDDRLLNDIKRERDDAMNQNEVLRSQVHDHENNLQTLHQEFENKNQNRADSVAKLKSECSTAKAMASALESQLRSRFTNEEYLTNSVMELETQLSDLKNDFQKEKSKLMDQRDTYENENIKLKRIIDESKKKNGMLQSKLAEVNKEMSAVLASHGVLNAEHDRMMDINLRVESNLIEAMRAERENILGSMRKQWKFFENAIQNQEQIIEDSRQREVQVLDLAKTEREKTFENIKSMRQDFLNARASALERQRTFQTEKVSEISSHSDPKKPRSVALTQISTFDHSSMTSQRSKSQTKDNSDQSSSRSKKKKKILSSQRSVSSSNPIKNVKREVLSLGEKETRSPSFSHINDSTEKRQQASPREDLESNFLRLLETRADQGSGMQRALYNEKRADIPIESTNPGRTLPHLRQNKHEYESIRLLNMPKSNQIPNLTSFGSASSMQSNTLMSKTSASSAPDVAKTLRKLQNLTIDNLSQSAGSRATSIDDSDSEFSTRSDKISLRGKSGVKSTYFPGMSTGMRRGMIRISEESSETDSLFSLQ